MNVNWLFKDCRSHREAISLLAAGGLPEAEAGAVRAHLAGCSRCQARFEQLRNVAQLGAQLQEHLPDATPSVALRQRWTAAITATRSNEPREPAAVWLGLLGGRRIAWGALAAMWALILVFRFTAPETAKPAVAAADLTWKEILLALQTEPDAVRQLEPPASRKSTHQSQPALPPRTELRERLRTNSMENV